MNFEPFSLSHDAPDTVDSISGTVIAVVLGHERSVQFEGVCVS